MNGNTSLPHGLASAAGSISIDHHEREHVWFVINRAYQNIYGLNLPMDPTYQKTIFDAALCLKKDNRSQHFSDKRFIQICEDIIRIADEHTRLAKLHRSRCSNPVYLRETALDNALEKDKYLSAIGANKPNSAIVTAKEIQRVEECSGKPVSSSQIMELAYQQLSVRLQKEPS